MVHQSGAGLRDLEGVKKLSEHVIIKGQCNPCGSLWFRGMTQGEVEGGGPSTRRWLSPRE